MLQSVGCSRGNHADQGGAAAAVPSPGAYGSRCRQGPPLYGRPPHLPWPGGVRRGVYRPESAFIRSSANNSATPTTEDPGRFHQLSGAYRHLPTVSRRCTHHGSARERPAALCPEPDRRLERHSGLPKPVCGDHHPRTSGGQDRARGERRGPSRQLQGHPDDPGAPHADQADRTSQRRSVGVLETP